MGLLPALGIILTALTAISHGQTPNIAQSPRDKTVKVGNNVQLECGINGNLDGTTFEWRARNQLALNEQLGDSIYQVPPRATGEPSNPNHYDIEGTYNLIIKQTTLNDGGWYSCRLGLGDYQTANLVVVEEPQLNGIDVVMTDGVVANIDCSVQYSAPSADVMQSSHIPKLSIMVGDRMVQTSQVTENPRQPDSNDYKVLHVKAPYQAKSEDHGEEMFCKVSTDDPSFELHIQKHLDIRFRPMNITISPFRSNGEYYIGENITCHADGNPKPRLEWNDVTRGNPQDYSSATLVINRNMVGFNVWRCLATNNVQPNSVIGEFQFTVLDEENPDEPQRTSSGGTEAWKIAVPIVIVLLVIILIVVVVYYCCFVKCRSPKYAGGDEAAMGEKPVYDNRAASGHSLPQPQRPTRPAYENTPNNNVNKGYSSNPNPNPNPDQPIRTGRDSPGYADLGVHQIRASNPELNLNVSFDQQSEGEGDRSFSIKPDAGYNNQNYQGSPSHNTRQPAPHPRYQTNTEV